MRGFTMVELMAVLIILGLLAAVVVRNFVGQVDQGKVIQTKANLKLLHTAVNEFHMDCGRWPGEDEGLTVLIQQPADVTNYPPGRVSRNDRYPQGRLGTRFHLRAPPGKRQAVRDQEPRRRRPGGWRRL